MKKMLAMLCIVFGLIGFCACEPAKTGEQNKADEIAEAYAEIHNGKASDVVYASYGEFDGANVLIIFFRNSVFSTALSTETVDGVDFHFSVVMTFDVYREGAFYTLQEAFDNEWLNHADLLTVRSKHKAENEKIYESFKEQEEDDKSPIVLEKEIKQEIKAAFVKEHKNDKYPVKEDEISLRCYGSFDGVYVLFVDVESWAYTDEEWSEVIGDVEFFYGSGQTMTVYSDGVFYSLAEAYENGILSRDNLLTVRQNRNEFH